eukprot:scaffold229341_cov35-Tisochrysis_lutea.AAC.1
MDSTKSTGAESTTNTAPRMIPIVPMVSQLLKVSPKSRFAPMALNTIPIFVTAATTDCVAKIWPKAQVAAAEYHSWDLLRMACPPAEYHLRPRSPATLVPTPSSASSAPTA